MKNSYNLQEFELVKETKSSNKIINMLLIIFIIGIFIIIYKFNFKIYIKYELLNENNNYMILAESNQINYIEKYKYIYINKMKYNYRINYIDPEYINISGTLYQKVFVDIKNYDTNANIIDIYFLKSNNTIFDTLIKFITGGF